MKNLAGDEKCDTHIERELTRCGIEVVRGERSANEVAASITGKLGAFTFRRAWYYWVVEGPMPLTAARKLYDDPVGRTDIRVNGHCACPSPDERPWATHYDTNGLELAFDNGGKEPEQFDAMIAKGFLKQADKDKYVFVPDPAAVAVTSFIESYHVDSELGLYILANAIRSLETK